MSIEMDVVKDGGIGLSMECEDDELLPWQLETHEQNEPVLQTLAVKVLTDAQEYLQENMSSKDNFKVLLPSINNATAKLPSEKSNKVLVHSEIDQMNFMNNFEPLPLQILTVDELNSLDLCGLYPDLSKDSEEFLIDGFDSIQPTLISSVDMNMFSPPIQLSWCKGLLEKPLHSFVGASPGLTKPFCEMKDLTPADFFKLFMPSKFLTDLAFSTNNFAESCNAYDWKKIDDLEIQAFIGLCVIMGVSPRTELTDYWSSDAALNNPFICKVMSLKKFQQISRYINFSNFGQHCQGHEQDYKFTLEKVASLLNTFCEQTSALYNLHQEIVILDVTNSFCHESGMKMNFPRNSSRLGWNLFLLRDSVSGYIKDMYIKITEGKPMENFLDVMEAFICNLEFKFHNLYLDKGLCSLDVCQYLSSHGIYVCGTSDARCIGIPAEFEKWSEILSSEEVHLKQGDCLTSQKEDTAIIVWAKTKENVVFMSTMHQAHDNFMNDHHVEGSLGCSKFISQYFRHLARHSAFRQNFSVQRISRSWWKYFLWLLIDISINNAYVLWSEVYNDGKTRKEFQLEVGKGLVNGFTNHSRQTVQQNGATNGELLNSQHVLIKLKGRARVCHMCRLINSKKPRESTYGCSACCVNLCRGQCFLQFHLQAVNKISPQKSGPLAEELQHQSLDLPEKSRSPTNSCTSSLSEAKQAKHTCIRLSTKKKICVQCQADGITWTNQHPKETIWGCLKCKVYLHKQHCFHKYHLKKGKTQATPRTINSLLKNTQDET